MCREATASAAACGGLLLLFYYILAQMATKNFPAGKKGGTGPAAPEGPGKTREKKRKNGLAFWPDCQYNVRCNFMESRAVFRP